MAPPNRPISNINNAISKVYGTTKIILLIIFTVLSAGSYALGVSDQTLYSNKL